MPEKQWVFDTVSLSDFLLSDSIGLIEKRYAKRGIITEAVYDELSSGMAAYPQLRQINPLVESNTLRLLHLSAAERKRYVELVRYLGKGEASCIAMAKQRAMVVVTDDRAARTQCTQMRISTTGTIGILKASVLDEHITAADADDILLRMSDAGFYSPVRTISDIV